MPNEYGRPNGGGYRRDDDRRGSGEDNQRRSSDIERDARRMRAAGHRQPSARQMWSSSGYHDDRDTIAERKDRRDREWEERSGSTREQRRARISGPARSRDERGYARNDRDRRDSRGYARDDRSYDRNREGDRGYVRDDRSRGYDREDAGEAHGYTHARDERAYNDRPAREGAGEHPQRREDERDGWTHKYAKHREREDRPAPKVMKGRYRAEQHGADIGSVPEWELTQPAEGTLFCPVAKRCGGCEWLSMPYEQQLEMKQEQIEELFESEKVEVEPIIGMDDPRFFRNKVQLPFAPGYGGKDGRTPARWGIFERGTHNIVPCRECLVEDKRARPIIAAVADLLPRFNILPYDERTGKGFLRYALVRTALHTDQVMLTLVCTSGRLPSSKIFVAELLKAHPEITTIVLNVNKERTSVILGDTEKVIYGPGYIEDRICGCVFRISSSSFYQTNPVQAEALYDLAIDMADLRPSDKIGDAYCGTGTIGIAAAKRSGAQLLGVERNADAVVDARANAEANGLADAEFVIGDAGSVFARMARADEPEQLDVVFMDPPRAGSTMAFLANLAKLAPRRVVYISCEPKSQRHDVTELKKMGYRVCRIRPVDMFPHTNHVENVIMLERVERHGRR